MFRPIQQLKLHLLLAYIVEASSIYASKKSWDKLNKEQQDVISAASAKAATTIIDLAWERSEDFIKQMEDAGWEILDYTPEQRTTMVNHIRDNVWPDLADVIGQETMDQLLAK